MDAHLFRRFCEDLLPALVGVRIEKIHQIVDGVTVFTLYGLGKLQERHRETEHDERGHEDFDVPADTIAYTLGDTHAKSTLMENDTISLFSEKKQYLVFKEGRSPLLFISNHRPISGEQPPAFVMRLRKHMAGRRIERVLGKWVERKLYMQIQGGAWLCLDLRQGMELILECPTDIFPETVLENNSSEITEFLEPQEVGTFNVQEFSISNENQETSVCNNNCETKKLLPFSLSYGIEPMPLSQGFSELWPEWNQVFAWCTAESIKLTESTKSTEPIESIETKNLEAGVEQEIWRNYPVLTPLFRKTIPYLDKEEGAALYADLQYGGGDIAVYVQGETKNKKHSDKFGVSQQGVIFEVCPWVLPKALAKKMGFGLDQSKELLFEDSISALMHVGAMLLVKLSQTVKNNVAKPLIAEAKRLERLLQKLQKEEERLLQMLAKKEIALVLQANLYNLNADEKEKRITFKELDGKTHTIDLDPSKSIRENMEYFFHVAGRGKRGLEHLGERRKSVAHQHEMTLQYALQESAMQKGFENKKELASQRDKVQTKNNGLSEKKTKVSKGSQFNAVLNGYEKNKVKNNAKNKQKFPVQVQAFRSSEGFLILRGRDTKGNGLVLRMSNPYDYWIHVATGTGAHVIIRRDHPKQEIPLQTMHEAGILAILKSWQKDQDKGLAQYSLAKYIRPMKGAGAGMVYVDKSEGTFLVSVEPSLEDTLKV